MCAITSVAVVLGMEEKYMESETQIAALKSELIALKDKYSCMQSQRDELELEANSLRCKLHELERQNDRFLSIIENLSKRNCE